MIVVARTINDYIAFQILSSVKRRRSIRHFETLSTGVEPPNPFKDYRKGSGYTADVSSITQQSNRDISISTPTWILHQNGPCTDN